MIQQDHEKGETMLPCEGPGRDIMSVRVRHIPMARGGGGGPTKSITRFDRLDCGPVAASCRLVSWGRRRRRRREGRKGKDIAI